MVIYAIKVIKITCLPINHIFFIFKHLFSLHIYTGRGEWAYKPPPPPSPFPRLYRVKGMFKRNLFI